MPEAERSTPAPVELSGLDGETVLLPAFQGVRGLREDIEAACAGAGLPLRSTGEAGTLTAMLLMVAAGAGVALVPATVARSFPLPGVQLHRLSSTATTRLGICWRRDDPSQVVADFLDTARGQAPRPGPIRETRAE